MSISASVLKWIVWIVLTMITAVWLGYIMLSETADKTIFMPGELSPGHHQLVDACDACHADAFGGGEILQQSCVDCHGKDRVKPFDSHPAKKFKDPRNAELLANIDALKCITCHTEHRPEITEKDGLTQPEDFCVHCHEKIAEDRPSHEGMTFDSCKDSGCHNYHNNRALYTNFLIKHLDEPPTLKEVVLPVKEYLGVIDEIADYPRDKYPLVELEEKDIDAVEVADANPDIKKDWLETSHSKSGVNCSACHISMLESAQEYWDDHPEHTACAACHSVEVERFTVGKHGMRLKQGLSAMTPQRARLPMKEAAAHEMLTCNSCHSGHRFDVVSAAVESCLGCHDDEHSLAYKQSQHYILWQKEVNGEADAGSGVSCASCHMPRVDYDVSEWLSRTIVDHNQSANLSPNTKMLRSSCLHCHGLEFTLDVMTDENLIDNNFRGKPVNHITTMELADKENRRRLEEASEDEDASMFGF